MDTKQEGSAALSVTGLLTTRPALSFEAAKGSEFYPA
jgi:hypothetical protein